MRERERERERKRDNYLVIASLSIKRSLQDCFNLHQFAAITKYKWCRVFVQPVAQFQMDIYSEHLSVTIVVYKTVKGTHG